VAVSRLGKVIAGAGVVGAFIGAGAASAHAANQISQGDVRGAGRTMTGFAGGFLGGIATAALSGSVLGPVGILGGIAIGIGTGIVGGGAGEWVTNWLYDSAFGKPGTRAQSPGNGAAGQPSPKANNPFPPLQPQPYNPQPQMPGSQPQTNDPSPQSDSGTGGNGTPGTQPQQTPDIQTPNPQPQPPPQQTPGTQPEQTPGTPGGTGTGGNDTSGGAGGNGTPAPKPIVPEDWKLLGPSSDGPPALNNDGSWNIPINCYGVPDGYHVQSLGGNDYSVPDGSTSQPSYPTTSDSTTNNSANGGGTADQNNIDVGAPSTLYGTTPSEVNGSASPVVHDLTGNGIKITPLSSSNMFFDLANDGYQQHTAWAGAGNGVLVYDPSGGAITQANQVNFTLWDPAAKTDMQALENVFDTNHDGTLNASDASWSSFRIMVTNADGTTTLETLAQAGVTAINLQANAYRQTMSDGSSIGGETTFTRTDGSTGTADTVSFATSGDYVVQQSVTQTAAGATVLQNSAYTQDGQLAEQITTTTSANGLDRTTTYDWNGDGVIDQTQTGNTVVNSDGSATRTVTDTNGWGVVLDSTTTTTSVNGLVVTIDRDTTGAGYTNQQEVDTRLSTGSSSVRPRGKAGDRDALFPAWPRRAVTQSMKRGSGEYRHRRETPVRSTRYRCFTGPANRRFTDSRIDWNTTYSIGIRNTPIELATIMPANTAVPTARRLSMAAPVAQTSGISPKMNAIEVINTARIRILAPSDAASRMESPDSRASLANSTIRMPFFAASAISTTMPIWAYRSSDSPEITSPKNAPSTPTVTDSSTGIGIIQLS